MCLSPSWYLGSFYTCSDFGDADKSCSKQLQQISKRILVFPFLPILVVDVLSKVIKPRKESGEVCSLSVQSKRYICDLKRCKWMKNALQVNCESINDELFTSMADVNTDMQSLAC